MQAMPNLRGVRVGVLGGGITGLTCAYYLLRVGADVTILEARNDIGGLSASFDFGPFQWDKFYHCVLTSDVALLELIEDLGLSSELRWTHTKVGFFADGRLHSMSSGVDFLRFPPLNLWQKMRLGAGILYASRIKDGRKLESELASDWLRRIFGQANYDKMWAPLLKCKLGACREEASAAFIWATIARLFSTRENKNGTECLGYVRGGYRTVFTRLVQEVRKMGGEIRTGVPLSEISSNGKVAVTSGNERFEFDCVVATIPSPVLARIAPQLSSHYVGKLEAVKYLGVVCFALVLKRALRPYYVTNLIDDVPFTGIIEMTNLISREETTGYHLVYLPKYTAPGDPLFELSEDEIWQTFREGLKRVTKDLSDSDIEARHLFRERFVQPIPVLHYSESVPPMETNVDGLVVANTTQIINSTLNNNEMVKIARRAVATVSNALRTIPGAAAFHVPVRPVATAAKS
jgi:protoporphyrinogen oxidase